MAGWPFTVDPVLFPSGAVSLAAAAVLLGVAALVLRAGPSRPGNQLFGLFLLLVAGNAVLEGLGKWTAYGPEQVLLDRLSLAFLALDPGVLLYFAATHPRRSRLADHPAFLPALVASWLVLAGLVVFAPAAALAPARPAHLPRALLVLNLAACYLGAYALMVARLRTETSAPLLRQQELLAGALGIALVFRVALVPQELLLVGGSDVVTLPIVLSFALLAAVAWASLRAAAADARPALARAHRITAAGLAVLAAFAAGPLVAGPLLEPATARLVQGFTGASLFLVRWLAFATIGGYAMLRYQVFGLDLRVRRYVEAGAAGAALLLVAGAAVAAGGAAGGALAGLGPGQVVGLALAVALAPAAARWGLRAAQRRWPAPAGDDPALRRLDFYRASLEGALQGGRFPGAAEGELRALRDDLGIAEEQHRVLLDVVRLEARGRGRAPLGEPDRLGGRYQLGEVLGVGAHGRCLAARDLLLGRDVVVKEAWTHGDGGAALREARAAGRLNHPNVVTVHDVLEGPGVAYLVMERAEGSLRDLLRRGPAPPSEAVRILEGVLDGLAAAHARGLVHGDVKPENVLLAAGGRPKVADFGSAAAAAPAGATLASLPTRAGPGTLLYLAPEQVEGRPPTPASDLYAVAAVAYELLTGEHYLELRGKGDFQIREAILRARPRLPREDLPVRIQAWLERGLAKAPGARWPDAGAMRDALRAAVQDLDAPPAGPGARGRGRRRP